MATVELDPAIEALTDGIEIPVVNEVSLATMRESRLLEEVELSDNVVRTDHVVPGNPEVIVRHHRPVGVEGPTACLYSIHGGGYVLGNRDLDDAKLDRWCQMFGITGVSVEYRLAPETAYPGPLDDCYAGLRWTFENSRELGIDPAKIGLTGVSAGGGLCAGLGLLVRDRAEIPVQFQLLDCPMIDDRQQTPSSQLDGLFIWPRESNTFGWKSYLGDLYGDDDVPAYAAAARSEDLSGLPETYVCVGGADGFRDENTIHAMRLNGAGVPAELHVYPGAPHGIGLFGETDIAKRYDRDQTDWLGRQLDRIR